jgi:hypothetical protein
MAGAAFPKENRMTRFKLLLVAAAVLVSTVAVQPVKSDGCLLQGLCRTCNTVVPTKQPCKFNPCTGEYICGSCTTNCVLPPV